MSEPSTPSAVQESFRRRRLERNIALVPLLASWVGLAFLKVNARPHSHADEDTFFMVLAAVLVLTLGVIVFTKVRWRCPACSASLWGNPRPIECPTCSVRLTPRG